MQEHAPPNELFGDQKRESRDEEDAGFQRKTLDGIQGRDFLHQSVGTKGDRKR